MLTPAHSAALVRIAVGLYFVKSAFQKTTAGWFASSDPMLAFLQANIDGSEPFYRQFIEQGVLIDPARVAQLVVIGEWVAGGLLVLGLLSRLGAIVGIAMVLNFALAKGLMNALTAPAGNEYLFIAILCALALTPVGLIWGLDGALRPALSSNPVGRWLAALPVDSRAAIHAVSAPEEVHRAA